MSNRKIAAVMIIFWAAVFVHLETKMFGSNWYPKTIAELVCDSIGLAASCYGWYLMFTKKSL